MYISLSGKGKTGPKCDVDIDECKDNPCKNNGICVNIVGSYSCNCTTQFYGSNCELDIDECAGSEPLCENGGFCVNHYGGYQCGCLFGFGGPRCQFESHCYSMPCQNLGSCTMKNGEPKCVCRDGFMGKYCEQLYGVSLLKKSSILVSMKGDFLKTLPRLFKP